MALQKNRDIRRIAIVGAGTSGYLTAFFLSQKYPNKSVDWFYPEENSPIGVGEALIPDVSHFLNDLGITHKDIIKHCNGTLKVGIKFEDFNQIGENFTFPFGVGQSDNYGTFSIDRIIETSKVPSNILEYSDISVHFRATELLAYLDTLVHTMPNLHIHRKIVSYDDVKDYDLIIDSTGFKKVIANWENNFAEITERIPNNQALVFRHPYTNKEKQCKPYSIFKAMSSGWIWNIPLGDQLAVGYVHNNKYDVKEEFIEYVKQKFEISDEISVGVVKMRTGRNNIHIKDNIVAIGLSSAFIEPIESTGLYFVTSALTRLKTYIDGDLSQDEYNKLTNEEFDSVTNFIIAHYKFSKRSNEYWDYYKNIDVELNKEIEIFPMEAWDYVLSGFGKAERPKSIMNPRELIDIERGTEYYKWLENERNTS